MHDRILPEPAPLRQLPATPPEGAPQSAAAERRAMVRARLPPDQVALGDAVRELRARRGLSQEHLGFRGGLHRNYVGGIERGELNITFRVMLKLTKGLGVPLSELIGLYERNRAKPRREER